MKNLLGVLIISIFGCLVSIHPQSMHGKQPNARAIHSDLIFSLVAKQLPTGQWGSYIRFWNPKAERWEEMTLMDNYNGIVSATHCNW